MYWSLVPLAMCAHTEHWTQEMKILTDEVAQDSGYYFSGKVLHQIPAYLQGRHYADGYYISIHFLNPQSCPSGQTPFNQIISMPYKETMLTSTCLRLEPQLSNCLLNCPSTSRS